MNKKSQAEETGPLGISLKSWLWFFMLLILGAALFFLLKNITSIW